MLTSFEQYVYNTWLATTRSAQNKPFTLRKDFSDFTEENPNYRLVQKLASFFKKYQEQVNMIEFFRAPYEIYKDNEQYDLKFYVTQKAISLYSMYSKRQQENSPDNEDQLKSIKESLEFIIKFCHERGIKFTEYLQHKETDAVVEAYLGHFKNRQTNLYVLLQFPEFEKRMYALDQELRYLFFGDIPDNLTKYKIKLYKSQRAKKLIESTYRKAISILH